jgi:hypothetical protein
MIKLSQPIYPDFYEIVNPNILSFYVDTVYGLSMGVIERVRLFIVYSMCYKVKIFDGVNIE